MRDFSILKLFQDYPYKDLITDNQNWNIVQGIPSKLPPDVGISGTLNIDSLGPYQPVRGTYIYNGVAYTYDMLSIISSTRDWTACLEIALKSNATEPKTENRGAWTLMPMRSSADTSFHSAFAMYSPGMTYSSFKNCYWDGAYYQGFNASNIFNVDTWKSYILQDINIKTQLEQALKDDKLSTCLKSVFVQFPSNLDGTYTTAPNKLKYYYSNVVNYVTEHKRRQPWAA